MHIELDCRISKDRISNEDNLMAQQSEHTTCYTTDITILNVLDKSSKQLDAIKYKTGCPKLNGALVELNLVNAELCFRETCLHHYYHRQSHIRFKTFGDNKSFKNRKLWADCRNTV